jgi:hypothetical protein
MGHTVHQDIAGKGETMRQRQTIEGDKGEKGNIGWLWLTLSHGNIFVVHLLIF